MDDDEARRILESVVVELRREQYGALVARYLRESEERTIVAESGTRYQVEVQAFWDGLQSSNLRVIVAIDDGGRRAFSPLSTDFIIAADGHFVGE